VIKTLDPDRSSASNAGSGSGSVSNEYGSETLLYIQEKNDVTGKDELTLTMGADPSAAATLSTVRPSQSGKRAPT